MGACHRGSGEPVRRARRQRRERIDLPRPQRPAGEPLPRLERPRREMTVFREAKPSFEPWPARGATERPIEGDEAERLEAAQTAQQTGAWW